MSATICAVCRRMLHNEDSWVSVCERCFPPKERAKACRTNREGLPVDAKDWTEADWQDFHEAIEAVKAKIAARHAKSKERVV